MREQTIKDALGTGVRFHEDLPRVKKEELLAENVILRDGKVIEDWDGEWGATDFALLMVEREGGQAVTTLCGGRAVVRQIRRLVKANKLPGRYRCFLNQLQGENGLYYLLDWTEPVSAETESVPAVAVATEKASRTVEPVSQPQTKVEEIF